MSANDTQVGGSHYKDMGIQTWDVVDTWPLEQRIGYYRGNALKYVMRLGRKDAEAQEAGKAIHYLQKLVEVLTPAAPAPAPAEPAHEPETAEWEGVRYREAPETNGCDGCAFDGANCTASGAWRAMRGVFGGGCSDFAVIYLRADTPAP